MNLAQAVGALILVLCGVATLGLQIRHQVADQTTKKETAAQTLRRNTLIEGYNRRTNEVTPVFIRVIDLLNDVIAQGHSAVVDRQLNRAINILTDGQGGKPDAITASSDT